MQDAFNHRQHTIDKWEHESRQQLFFSVTVGILGLLAGLFQGSQKPLARVATVVVGFCVSAITLFTNQVYPADYRTYQRLIAAAAPILESLDRRIKEFDSTQGESNQSTYEQDFYDKCSEIDTLGQKMLGVGSPTQESLGKAKATLFLVPSVYAQTKTAAPDWASSNIESNDLSTYVVGVAESESLSTARSVSYENALRIGAHWLRGDKEQSQVEIPPELLALVRQSADTANSDFVYDSSRKVYTYYTRLRLTNLLRHLDLSNLTPKGGTNQPDLVAKADAIKLNNDSAVRVGDVGITLVIKHMGYRPRTADVYVVSGTRLSGDIRPYTNNSEASAKNIARFKALLPSCNGRRAEVDGNQVWCFRLDEFEMDSKTGKQQYLGLVVANGQAYDVYGTDFDSVEPMVEVKLRRVNQGQREQGLPPLPTTIAGTTVKLQSDSIANVGDARITLILGHMGIWASTTNLYVLSNPAGSTTLQAYARTEDLTEKYTKEFKHLFPSCNGRPGSANGHEVRCFQVSPGKHYLGLAVGNGKVFDLFVDVNWTKKVVQVELRPSNLPLTSS